MGHLHEQDTTANLRQLGPDLQKWPEEKKQRALQMIVHCCDIGNPAKPLKYSLQWTERIMAENFAQVSAACFLISCLWLICPSLLTLHLYDKPCQMHTSCFA